MAQLSFVIGPTREVDKVHALASPQKKLWFVQVELESLKVTLHSWIEAVSVACVANQQNS